MQNPSSKYCKRFGLCILLVYYTVRTSLLIYHWVKLVQRAQLIESGPTHTQYTRPRARNEQSKVYNTIYVRESVDHVKRAEPYYYTLDLIFSRNYTHSICMMMLFGDSSSHLSIYLCCSALCCSSSKSRSAVQQHMYKYNLPCADVCASSKKRRRTLKAAKRTSPI